MSHLPRPRRRTSRRLTSRRLRPLLLASLLLPACGGDDSPATAVEERDSAGVAIATIQLEREAVPEWTLGPVERVISGTEPPHFGRLGAAIWVADGGIAVADRLADRIHVFDRAGELSRTLGRSGDGPGEFRNIWGLSASGDSMMVHDLSHDRVSVFGPDGRLTRSFQLPVRSDEDVYERIYRVAPVGGGRYVAKRSRDELGQREAVTPNSRRYQNREALTLHGPDARTIAGPVHFPGAASVEVSLDGHWADARVFFAGGSLTAVGGGRTVYGNGTTFALTVLDSLLRPVRAIRWPRYSEPLDPDEVRALRESQMELFVSAGMAEMGREILGAVLDPKVLPDQRPALSRVLRDTEGRIWAGRFEPTEPPREWVVLDPAGAPAGRLTLPAGSQLADVRGDRLLLITRDSLDVESLEIRVLVRNGRAAGP